MGALDQTYREGLFDLLPGGVNLSSAALSSSERRISKAVAKLIRVAKVGLFSPRSICPM